MGACKTKTTQKKISEKNIDTNKKINNKKACKGTKDTINGDVNWHSLYVKKNKQYNSLKSDLEKLMASL